MDWTLFFAVVAAFYLVKSSYLAVKVRRLEAEETEKLKRVHRQIEDLQRKQDELLKDIDRRWPRNVISHAIGI